MRTASTISVKPHRLLLFRRVSIEHLLERFLKLLFISLLGAGNAVLRGLTMPDHFFPLHIDQIYRQDSHRLRLSFSWADPKVGRRGIHHVLSDHVVVNVQVRMFFRAYSLEALLGEYGVDILFDSLPIKLTALVFALLPGVGAIIRKGSVGLPIDFHGL